MSRAAWPALLAGAVLLSGCASSVGGLPVQWRADGPPVVTAPPGDCPALDGAYDSTGQAQGDETKTATLQSVLGRELGLTRLLAVNAEPAATVTIARAAGDDAWLVSDAHGEVRLAADGAPAPLDPDWSAHGSRVAGCANGRLWIGLSAVRTQYETMTETRALGVLSVGPDGGLIIQTRTERRHHAFLPWPSVQRSAIRYDFPAITAPASPAAGRRLSPPPSA